MLRPIQSRSEAYPAMDGDGVALKRNDLFDGRLDPFLMLDELKAKPDESPNSFPVHPHRGIQTLSYLIHGTMQHRDSIGTESVISAGGLQWMHTGRGIEHAEKPGVDTHGLWGFQFWLNVPRAEKYNAPHYQDVPQNETLEIHLSGATAHLLAGNWQINQISYAAPFQKLSGEAALADLLWQDSRQLSIQTSAPSLAIFVLAGQIEINGIAVVKTGELIQFADGTEIRLSGQANARILIFKGVPIGEPIVHRGPFVMTSESEIQETIQAYRQGTLVK